MLVEISDILTLSLGWRRTLSPDKIFLGSPFTVRTIKSRWGEGEVMWFQNHQPTAAKGQDEQAREQKSQTAACLIFLAFFQHRWISLDGNFFLRIAIDFVFPGQEDGTCNKYGRVCPHDDPNQEREGKIMDNTAAQEEKSQNNKQGGGRS